MKTWKTVQNDERGTITAFAISTYIVMITLAGFAIDTARVELDRTKIQVAVDNAALAAASLNQTVNPETGLAKTPAEVVALYMAKADIPSGFKDSYSVEQDETTLFDTSRSVSITGTESVSTMFMKMMGVDEFTYTVQSSALEAEMVDTEVSLILDISGSMLGEQKLGSLVTGAKEFVTAMLASNSEENPHVVSISLIPYSAYVNGGKDLTGLFENEFKDYGQKVAPEVAAAMNNTGLCSYFEDNAFQSAQQWGSNEMIPMMTWGYYNYSSSYGQTSNHVRTPWCPDFAWAEVLPLSNDETELHSRLDQFKPTTNTSIDDAVLWGTVLLDPTSRDEIEEMATGGYADLSGFPEERVSYVEEEVYIEVGGIPVLQGTETKRVTSSTQDVDSGFIGRPLDYGASNKIMVVMTDGYNTDQYRLESDFNKRWNDAEAGAAKHFNDTEIWWRPSDNRLAAFDEDGEDWGEDNGYIPLNWQELFAIRTVWEVASYRWDRSTDDYMFSYRNHEQKNARLHDVCREAKEEGVVIYTITYEASEYAAGLMDTCASTGAAYVATSTTISSVFGNIAQSARKLQLTQ